jgi:hypothetical protein
MGRPGEPAGCGEGRYFLAEDQQQGTVGPHPDAQWFLTFRLTTVQTESKHLGHTMGHIDGVCQIVGNNMF